MHLKKLKENPRVWYAYMMQTSKYKAEKERSGGEG